MEDGARATTHRPEKEISRGVTAIYKDYLGRGPTHSSTTLSDECSTTTLRDSMTRAERSLVNGGEAETVREMRRKFQLAMRDEIIAVVEGVTGRRCAAFLSDHNADEDIGVEIVVFETE